MKPTGLILLLVAVAYCGNSAAADDVAPELQELRARVESLERQNLQLQERIARDVSWDSSSVPTTDGPKFLSDPACPDCTSKAGACDVCSPNAARDLSMTGSWNNGLEFITRDKAFRVHVGGRTQFDASWYSADDNVQDNINIPYENGVDFRRARLRIDGTMYENIEWAVEYDFVNSARARNAAATDVTDFDVTALTDMWWTFTKLPCLGNVRIGNQKEPIGFEHLVSSRWLPFMERSFNQDAFYGGLFNGFTPGIAAFNNYADENGLWHIGLYKPTDNVFAYNAHSGDYAVTGRVTYLPWYEDEGRQLLHLGLSTRLSSSVVDRVRFRTRDAIRSGVSVTWPVPADTGFLFAEHQQWVNGELVAVHGPWTFQSEYLMCYVQDAQPVANGPEVGTLNYHGGYVQLLYFLTGESDHYNRKTAVFERVIPHCNFGYSAEEGCRGIGAWQIGARYNCLDLNDEGVNGGILHNWSCTLNWFLNPNMKVQFDYSATDRDAPLLAGAGDGWIHGWGMRVAHDF